MKKISIAIILFAMSVFVSAHGANYYYAKLTVKMNTGAGRVYVATSSTTSPVWVATQMSATGSSTTSQGVVSFFAYADHKYGYKFNRWDGSTGTQIDDPTKELGAVVTMKASNVKDKEASATTASVSPTYVACSADDPSYEIEYADSEFLQSYEVSVPAEYPSITPGGKVKTYSHDKLTIKAVGMDGYTFVGWYASSEGAAESKISESVILENWSPGKNSRIRAAFMRACFKVGTEFYESLEECLAKLSSSGGKIIQVANYTLPAESQLTIPKGVTLQVSSGYSLTVDGTMEVLGVLENSGEIKGSGRILLGDVSISQNTISKTTSVCCLNYTYYSDTEVLISGGSFSGTEPAAGLIKRRVSINGGQKREVSMSGQVPGAFLCAVNKNVAVNAISAVEVGCAYPEALVDDSAYKGSISSGDKIFLLSKKWTLSYSSKTGSKNFGFIDCANYPFSSSCELAAGMYFKFLNASDVQVKGKMTNPDITFINSTVSSLKFADSDSSGVTPLRFFDSKISAKITWSDLPKGNRVHFYSGMYDLSLDSTKSIVHGGVFKNDPSACLDDKEHFKAVLSEGYYHIRKNDMTTPIIGDVAYDTLADAVAAALEGTPTTITLRGETKMGADPLVIPEGKNITIELAACSLGSGNIHNYGTLYFQDSSQVDTKTDTTRGRVAANLQNFNGGQIDISYGEYSGDVILNGGVFRVHNGYFVGALSSLADNTEGLAEIRGGYFESSSVEDFLEEGYIRQANCIGVFPYAKVEALSVGAGSFAGYDGAYSLEVLSRSNPNDREIYNMGEQRDDYQDQALWNRHSELVSGLRPYLSYTVDCVLLFDRPVAAGSLVANALSEQTLTKDVNTKNSDGLYEYRAMSPIVAQEGSVQIPYASFLTEDKYAALKVGIKDVDGKNSGTKCFIRMDLCTGSRSTGDTADLSRLKSVFTLAEKCLVLGAGTNKAMTRPETGAATFYPTLAAAVANAEGQVILLTADDNETLAISKACVIDFDSNGFAFTGSIAAGDGFELTTEDLGDGKTRYTVAPAAVAQVGGTKYVTLAAAVDAAQATGEPILVLGAVPETVPTGFTSIEVNGKTVLIPESEPEVVVQAPDETFAVVAKDADGQTVEAPAGADKVADEVKGAVAEAGPVAVIAGTGVRVEDVCSAAAARAALQAVEDLKEDERAQITESSEVRRFVNVQLKAVEVTAEAAFAGLSFDVRPMAKTVVIDAAGVVKTVVAPIPNTELKGAITFRLPLTAAFTTSARIVHEDDAVRLVRVEQADGARYVTVSATHFSIFTVYPSDRIETKVVSSNIMAIKRVPGAGKGEVVAAVPWKALNGLDDITPDKLIATGVAEGDELAVWDAASQSYKTWRYNGTAWEASMDAKSNVEGPAAAATALQRGWAAWYKRGTPDAAYSQIGGYVASDVTTPTVAGGATPENKPASTLLINPFYEAVDLLKLTDCVSGDQIQVISTKKVYTYTKPTGGSGLAWCERKTVDQTTPFGTFKRSQDVAVTALTLAAGDAFWYVSKGGTPTIDWKSIGVAAPVGE